MNIPNFFIIGVVKGGTTSLYNYLLQHPDIYFSPIKETNFFARHNINETNLIKEYALDIKIDLKKYFTNGMKEVIHIAHIKSIKDYEFLFSKANSQKIIGEISNSYSICSKAIPEIKKYNPKAKLLIMLRNPVSRIWSQYIMNLSEGKTVEKNFIKEIETDFNKENKGWGVSHQYLELGLYYEQILRILKYFPKEQFKILFFEDYIKNTQNTLKEIFEFLEIDTNYIINFSSKHNKASLPRSKKINALLVKIGILKKLKDFFGRETRKKLKGLLYTDKNLPGINIHDKQYLISFYRDDVEKLSKLVKTDLIEKWGFRG
jgi:hypothetical protein